VKTSPTTVAVLGGEAVVTRALKQLIRGAGYEVRILPEPSSGKLGEALAGVNRWRLPR
jgi:hypothetical protein